MTPNMDFAGAASAIWRFSIADHWGNLILQGEADSYATLLALTRKIYYEYPADTLLIENAATGAGVMFVPDDPRVGTLMLDSGRMVEIVAQIYMISDWQVWDHLTSMGQFDPDGRSIDFLGDGPKLAAVQLGPNIVLN